MLMKKILYFFIVILLGFTLLIPLECYSISFNVLPYIKNITETTVTIGFESVQSTEGVILYGTANNRYKSSIKIPDGSQQIIIRGLKPGTRYYYYLKIGSSSTPFGHNDYNFTTRHSAPASVEFIVHNNVRSQYKNYKTDNIKMINSILKNANPEFILLPGNIGVDKDYKSDWINFLNTQNRLTRKIPIYATNNTGIPDSLNFFKKYFWTSNNNTYYSFDCGEFHFISLDLSLTNTKLPYVGISPESPQMHWLINDLRNSCIKKNKVTVVFFSTPLFSPDEKEFNDISPILHQLFRKYRVDLVFSNWQDYSKNVVDGIYYFNAGYSSAFKHFLKVRITYDNTYVEVIDSKGTIRSHIRINTTNTDDFIDSFSNDNNCIPLLVFSLPGCSYCEKLKNRIVPDIFKKAGKQLPVKYLYIDNTDNLEKLVYYENLFNDLNNELPAIVTHSRIIGGKKEIKIELEKTIFNLLRGIDNHSSTFKSENNKNYQVDAIYDRFKLFTIPVIFTAGLIDGINPCAFTTIIFLLSYLLYIGKRKKEILIGGAGFTLGVFLTYILLGVGLSKLINSIPAYSSISIIVKYAAFTIVVVLAIISLYDYILCTKGNTGKTILQLPGLIKKKIHEKIRIYTKKTKLATASIAIGFFISIFEITCTGQIYFPTIVYMLKVSNEKIKAFIYLVIYNIAFILPLVTVFLLSYYGLTAVKLTKLFKKRIALIKLFTFILFILLSVLIIV